MLKSTVMEYGGSVISNFRNIVDYAVVPVLFTQTKVTSNEIVTPLWLVRNSNLVIRENNFHY